MCVCDNTNVHLVENLLRFIKKESFGRAVGELPRKLTAYESRNMQLGEYLCL